MKNVVTILVGLFVVTMVGCSPLENQARNTAAALSGSLVAAQTKYQATCGADPAQDICQMINRGVSGENALITAIETYCGWSVTVGSPDPGSKCVGVKSAEAALQAAISNAASLTTEIKGAL